MEIRVAKTAGFCFGVNRAVELTYGLLEQGHRVATLGPLIHNPQAVEDMKRRGVFPAGRLDKNTTGFVLLTNDGAFAHNILSPKKHIPKEYIAELDKPFNENIILQFERGVDIGGEICLPAVLSPCENDYKKARIVIRQGRYHQIKRMFSAFGIKVVELKRISMGSLALDENLAEGDCRYLTSKEVDKITK